MMADEKNTGENVLNSHFSVLPNIAELEEQAKQGKFRAMVRLAKLYFEGHGVQKDPAEAVQWLKKAIEKSRTGTGEEKFPSLFCVNEIEEVLYKLGECYSKGVGVKKDDAKAFEWYRKAAEKNSTQNDEQVVYKHKVADCYLNGIGVTKDRDNAKIWLKKSAEDSRSPRYQINIALRFIFEEDIRDLDLAITCLECTTGQIVFDPEIFDYRDDKAIALANDECKAKTQAQALLGICYFQKYSLENEKALEFFEKASKANEAVGCLWLASMYQRIRHQGYLHMPTEGNKSWDDIDLLDSLNLGKYQIGYIYNQLFKAAAAFFIIDGGYDYTNSNIIEFIFPPELIGCLKKHKITPSKIVLAFYHRCKGEQKEYLEYLKEAADSQDLLANYLLGMHHKHKNDFETASSYFKKVAEGARSELSVLRTEKETEQYFGYQPATQDFLAYSAKEELNNIKHLEEIEEKNKALHDKEKEMLAFFTHTLRNALAAAPESLRQAIQLLGGDDYEKNTKHYQAINKIASLFSTLSLTDCLIDTFKQTTSDPQEFRQSWELDHNGEATPKWVIASALRQTLNRIVFLSDTTELRKLLNNPETALIKATRKAFIDEVLPLNVDSLGVETLFRWGEQHIPAINVSISDNDELHFGANQVRFSLLFAITSELIMNALKYWDGENRIQINWQIGKNSDYVFSVQNHCKANATSHFAGTHKGLAFIKRLVELLGENARFNCTSEDQLFKAELILNKALFEGES